jgi:AAA family ATP:ADP antiporter
VHTKTLNVSEATLLDRSLGIFTRVHAREGATSLLLLLNIFLILVSYYFIKPVREGWLSVSVVAGLSPLELKSYSAFGQSLLLLGILPLYAAIAARVSRRKLITGTALVSAVALLIFWLLQPGLVVPRVRYSGVAFYMFVGIFSVTLVAQFWSFASDMYGHEKGRRLFPLVAVGASSGAVCGSWLGERLIRIHWLDSFDLILLAVLPLGSAVLLARWIDRRGSEGDRSATTIQRHHEPAAPQGRGAFRAIFENPYLLATAGMILLFNWIVASGDNILFGIVQQALATEFAQVGDSVNLAQAIKTATTAFYGDLYFWVNLIGLLLQAFIVSRLLQFGGFTLLILATPLVSLVAYFSMAIAPILGIIKVMKVAENSSNYSINNTARHMLWLPTTKAMMYQSKATIDTLCVRIGDGMAAFTVLLGTRIWSFSLIDFLIINIFLSMIWIGFAAYLSREFHRWSNSVTAVAA